ncbi:MAG TPA: ornithine--oxo-acid transaminase [Longimicrobiales bacterium]|nr:ornithine--oxo-acid transaminase [Longimicrobiales bacterium]
MKWTEQALSEAERYSAHNYHPLPVVLARGEGIYVWDLDGKRYVDMLSAYSAVNQGHRHPRIIRALVEQAERITLTSRAFHNDRMGPFLHLLCDITGYERALPMNTGAEAVETAIKAARKWGYEKKGVHRDAEIIVFDGNFHGRTTTIISFSSEPLYREGFGPFTPGFKILPYGNLGAVAAAINERTVAVLVEPIQGEAGVVLPPPGFMRGLATLCKEHRLLLISDEIQTGLGRTGKLFASDWEGVRADITVVGKALGGGVYPVSAILANREVMDVFTPGTHGSTFGGNPLGAAVGTAALSVLVEEKLAEHAHQVGEWFMKELRSIDAPAVEEVRGRGLLIGVVIRKEYGLARPYCEALMRRGILAKETHDQVVRFAPPLVVTSDQLKETLPAIRDVLLNTAAEIVSAAR